jgi:hypothetical protein
MNYLAVSTFNQSGLRQYGQRMMASFVLHWPEQIALRVYAEGWKSTDNPGVAVFDLEANSDWLGNFKQRHAHRRTNNFRMDAVKFAHKIAALVAADETCGARYLIWLDGDIVTHAPIHLVDIENLSPRQDQWISWLDRKWLYPECGFYIIDRHHHRHVEAMMHLRRMYDGDALFRESEWHDSYILKCVVQQLNIDARNISGPGYRTAHPFINSPLGKWMDHLKGNRKSKGRSDPVDLRFDRDEKYWR